MNLTTNVNVLYAIMYGLSAFCIVFVNKIVLSTFRFPSFLVLSFLQTAFTVALFSSLHMAKVLEIKRLNRTVLIAILPLVILFLFNLTFGLGSTKYLTLPMFTSLRHSTVLITMLLEVVFLRLNPKNSTIGSVCLIICGVIMASCFDGNFNLFGYIYLAINNTSTALNGVYVKYVLNKDVMSTTDVMFYNNLFTMPILFFLCKQQNELEFSWLFFQLHPHRTTLAILVVISLTSGLFLTFFMFQCTKHNSALATAFIGVFKNVIITYTGMFTGDYAFNWCNFLGVTLTTFGSLIYFISTFSSPMFGSAKKINVDTTRAVVAA